MLDLYTKLQARLAQEDGQTMAEYAVVLAVIAIGIFVFETKMPVFHEVVKIIYFILLVILVIATGRWLRVRRGRRRTADRRHAERRRGEEDR